MTMPRKSALITASLALVASATGCGMGGPPTDASEKEFCGVVNSLFEDVLSGGEEPSQKETVAAVKKWGKEMEEVGTPESISDEGRKGFEVIVEQVAELDEDASVKDMEELDKDLSDSEDKAVDVFDDYMTETCNTDDPEAP